MDIKIAVIEDDKKLNEGICLSLKEPGRIFFPCRTLAQARQCLQENSLNLILLDVNLPDGSGIDFVRKYAQKAARPSY